MIDGTRISVEQILGLIANGATEREITASHPILAIRDVRAAVAYAQQALRDDIVVEVT